MHTISVVSPVYKAEACIEELCRRLISELSRITDDFEIILVEDHGPDRSWEEILKQASLDSRIKGVKLSRNFGQHYAITAGLDIANGDWIVVMDCDLQDSPEDIPKLYAKANEGFDVVLGAFEDRTERVWRQFISRGFWRLLSRLAGTPFDPRVGNFRIMSRRVVLSFRQFREQLRFLGGIVNLVGFPTTSIPLKRSPRFAGESAYSFTRLLETAVDIVMAYSDKPLKISVGIGLVMAVVSFAVGAIVIMLKLLGKIEVEGWASVMVSLFVIGGIIIVNLGIIGYYLGRTYDETKRRPLYIVEQVTTSVNQPGRAV
jgi:dolichol-phosphate mannosyltransferase